MHEHLIDAMREYLDAGAAMDLERLGACYADDFTNVRVDRAGVAVTITRAQFMARFAAMKAAGAALEPATDATFPATTVFGDLGTVVMRRVKNGRPVLYAFVWRLAGGRPAAIVRELTFEDDLSPLLAAMQ